MKSKIVSNVLLFLISAILNGCVTPKNLNRSENKNVPAYNQISTDTVSIGNLNWRNFYQDQNLINLIDTALKNNQELNIIGHEVLILQNEIRARKGEYLPFLGLGANSDFEKLSTYAWRGAVEDNLNVQTHPEIFESKSDLWIGANSAWEIDIWKKLRNAKKSAIAKYLAGMEGRNFLITNLIAEIAENYYELIALDNLNELLQKNITLQSEVVNIVNQQKLATKVTQLAVNRFEAQLLNTKTMQFEISQRIIETENHLRLLTGSYLPAIPRNSKDFYSMAIDSMPYGISSQLLTNRADIRQAENELNAAKLDVAVAKANFYPSLAIKAGIGYNAFNPKFLVDPLSLVYNLSGELMAPLINRNAIKANYNTATSKQMQAIYKYEQTILTSYIEVQNYLAGITNYRNNYENKLKEVKLLEEAVLISKNLFNSARADYSEVLFTQKDVLLVKKELIEIKLNQLKYRIGIYKALGGGWKS